MVSFTAKRAIRLTYFVASGTLTTNARDDARRDALPDVHGPNSHRSSLDIRRNSRSRTEDSSRSRIHNEDTRIRSRIEDTPRSAATSC